MVLLEKLWDDVIAGPQPERGLGKLRKIVASQPLNIKGCYLALSFVCLLVRYLLQEFDIKCLIIVSFCFFRRRRRIEQVSENVVDASNTNNAGDANDAVVGA